MAIIGSFVNVIAGVSVLLGNKSFMDDKVGGADGPKIRDVIGVPLLGVGVLGILVSYVRNKSVRGEKKAETFEAEHGCPICKGEVHGDMSMIGEEIDYDICGDCDIYIMPQGISCIECGFGDPYGSATPCESCEPIADKMKMVNKNAETFDAESCPNCSNEMGRGGCYSCGYGMPANTWLQLFGAESCPNCSNEIGRGGCYSCGYGMPANTWLQLFGAENGCPICKGEVHGDMSMIGEEIDYDICGDCDIYIMPQGISCIECGFGDPHGSATPCESCEPIADKMKMVNKNAETFNADGGLSYADVPDATLGGTTNNPVRIIVGGPPHSGKSTLMNLIEDKMNQYGVSVELRDLDFSAPTDLKGGFDENREKKEWTPELAKDAANYFNEDSERRVILGDSIGLISQINEIVAEPADVAILLVSGSQGDDERTYREVMKKWFKYYDHIDMPVLMVIRSSMNPEEKNYFDPHDNYGVIVGLDRNAYNQGGDSNEISLENACLEGIVFEIAQEFDLGLANRSSRKHIGIVEQSWPKLKGKGTWNPIDAGKPHLAKVEDEYFEELERRNQFRM